MCGGKGHSAEICAYAATALAREGTKGCNDECDVAISGEEEEAFMCETSGECSDDSNDEGGCSTLA